MSFRKVRLTQGKSALVDAADFELVSRWKWYFHKKPADKTGYAIRNGKRGRIAMHAFLLGRKGVDHANGNGLDNRRKNLRLATATQQAYNKPKLKRKRTPGCKGVSVVRDRHGKPAYWIARVTVRGVRKYLGTFPSPSAASRACIGAMRELHGEFARWK